MVFHALPFSPAHDKCIMANFGLSDSCLTDMLLPHPEPALGSSVSWLMTPYLDFLPLVESGLQVPWRDNSWWTSQRTALSLSGLCLYINGINTMSKRTPSLLQDQNLNVHVNGGGTVSAKNDLTGQGKARARARKPLGDLSNAGNLINQFDGKKALAGSLHTGKSSVGQASKLPSSNNLESDKSFASKASGKSLTGIRKVLSDISNSGKPQLPEIKIKNTKPSLLVEESDLSPSAIAEEYMQHDHKKCIESRSETVDMHKFFILADSEDDLPTIAESPRLDLELVPECFPDWDDPPVNFKLESEYLDLELEPECFPYWHDSPVNFKLIETPKCSKT
ncbi:hypothetical protein VNO78_25737 [Psophocarpus tetragonolobus]|uniref:Uncharacterized protein n=1 Tax=Psophocarpus tetragonolobus TaxID=3891 RepID=A0AAN9XFP2_PSOTE